MNDQVKQLMAWFVSLSASAVLLGGRLMWLTSHRTSPSHSSQVPTSGEEHSSDAPQKLDHQANEHTEEAPANGTAHPHEGQKNEDHQQDDHNKKETPKRESHKGTLKEPEGRHTSTKDSHWTYGKGDATGPSHWGKLDDQFAQCEKGREQSPIDLKGAVTKASAPQIRWFYNPVAVNVENNGHTIVVKMPHDQNHILIDDEQYTLVQLNFHSPSEHRIGGIPSEMEMHLVHSNAQGGLAVIGVMLNEKAGGENLFLKPLWKILPRDFNTKASETPTLNLAKLLPTHRDYFHYKGSLTTPPCSEGVRWFVLKEPVTLSGSQVELYSGIFDGSTNRPVQPQFGRELIQSLGPASVAH